MENNKVPTASEYLNQAHKIGLDIQKDRPYKFTTLVEQIEDRGLTPFVKKMMIEFAKMHVQAALKAALEEVPYGGSDEVRYEDVVSILTCYPLDNIK